MSMHIHRRNVLSVTLALSRMRSDKLRLCHVIRYGVTAG